MYEYRAVITPLAGGTGRYVQLIPAKSPADALEMLQLAGKRACVIANQDLPCDVYKVTVSLADAPQGETLSDTLKVPNGLALALRQLYRGKYYKENYYE